MQNAVTITYVPNCMTLRVALHQCCEASELSLPHAEVAQLHRYIQIFYTYITHTYIHNCLNLKKYMCTHIFKLVIKRRA